MRGMSWREEHGGTGCQRFDRGVETRRRNINRFSTKDGCVISSRSKLFTESSILILRWRARSCRKPPVCLSVDRRLVLISNGRPIAHLVCPYPAISPVHSMPFISPHLLKNDTLSVGRSTSGRSLVELAKRALVVVLVGPTVLAARSAKLTSGLDSTCECVSTPVSISSFAYPAADCVDPSSVETRVVLSSPIAGSG